jgi:hypothetical protein
MARCSFDSGRRNPRVQRDDRQRDCDDRQYGFGVESVNIVPSARSELIRIRSSGGRGSRVGDLLKLPFEMGELARSCKTKLLFYFFLDRRDIVRPAFNMVGETIGSLQVLAQIFQTFLILINCENVDGCF